MLTPGAAMSGCDNKNTKWFNWNSSLFTFKGLKVVGFIFYLEYGWSNGVRPSR